MQQQSVCSAYNVYMCRILNQKFVLYKDHLHGLPITDGLSCYKRAETFTYRQRQREDSLVINQLGSDTYSTVRFHQLFKTPMYSFKVDAKWIHRALPLPKWCTVYLCVEK